MKSMRKAFKGLVVLAALLGMLCAMSLVGQAAAAKVPKAVRIDPKKPYAASFKVKYGAAGDKIKNIRTSSSALLAKWSHSDSNSDASEGYPEKNTADISLFTKREGTYKVTFDIYTKKGKKRSSHSVRVYARSDSPIKSYTLNGKKSESFGFTTTASSFRVRVSMNPGYRLKKLEYGVNKIVWEDDSWITKEVYTKFANGGKVKLNTKGFYYKYDYSDEDNTRVIWSDSIIASTSVKVTYVDKYTKKVCTTYINLPGKLNLKSSR